MKKKIIACVLAVCFASAFAACKKSGGGSQPADGDGFKLDKTAVTVSVGGTVQLTASGTTETVIWSSSDETVAAVTQAGLVTGVTLGNASVTARAGDEAVVCAVTVSDEMAGVPTLRLNRKTAVLYAGMTYRLDALVKVGAQTVDSAGLTFEWSTSDSAAADVADGLVTAKASADKVTITASCVYGGVTLSDACDFAVTKMISMFFKQPRAACALGSDYPLEFEALTLNNMTLVPLAVVFESSNLSAAEVNASTGVVTPKTVSVDVPVRITMSYDGEGGPVTDTCDLYIYKRSIATAADFLAIAANPNDTYVLTDDIDLTASAITGTAGKFTNFGGVLDGNGYTVSGVSLVPGGGSPVPSAVQAGVGLFNTVTGTIRNIGFDIVSTPVRAAGDSDGATALQGCGGLIAKKLDGAHLHDIYLTGSMQGGTWSDTLGHSADTNFFGLICYEAYDSEIDRVFIDVVGTDQGAVVAAKGSSKVTNIFKVFIAEADYKATWCFDTVEPGSADRTAFVFAADSGNCPLYQDLNGLIGADMYTYLTSPLWNADGFAEGAPLNKGFKQ
jgi:hypothetical protein